MNNDTDLRVARSFELLTRLNEVASEFTLKESKLSTELSSRRLAENRKYRSESESIESWIAHETSTAEATFSEREHRARTKATRRKEKIEHLGSSGLINLHEQAVQARERWLGKLQMRHFRASRNLPADLKNAEATFARFVVSLNEAQSRLFALEKRARRAFAGYGAYLKGLRARVTASELGDAGDYHQLFEHLTTEIEAAEEELKTFGQQVIPRVFSVLQPAFMIPLVLVAAAALGFLYGSTPTSYTVAGIAAIVVLGVGFVVHRIGYQQSEARGKTLIATLLEARYTHTTCAAKAQAVHQEELERLQSDYDQLCEEVNEQWGRAGEIESNFAVTLKAKLEAQTPRLLEKHERMQAPKLAKILTEREAKLNYLKSEGEARTRKLSEKNEKAIAELDAEESTRWEELAADWKSAILPIYQAIDAMNTSLSSHTPAWTPQVVNNWKSVTEFSTSVKFAELNVDLQAQKILPKNPLLALPGSPNVSIPLALTFPEQASILFETRDSGDPTVIATLNNIILRLLTTTPPGKLSFTIIDPVGLGQNFAGLMHLADFEEGLISRRIWTQKDQIEDRLAELSEHIEKVIQMYLRNEYATITEYNAQAGSVAEKYHYLVVADFPANFSETAAKRLQSIASSGPRCGVFTLIHWDRRQPNPDGFVPDELRRNSLCIQRTSGEWVFPREQQAKPGSALVFDQPPESELAVTLVHKIGESNIDSNRVQVPFSQIAPAPEQRWTGDTTNELKIAIGRTGATKLQYLSIGKGTRQHALFAGKTGSGKSTLFHVIITNLALTCSPEQVEFYLIDFKKGVEFKCYATNRLPHAKVIAIESDREFGLSVLQRVDEELKRRGDLFRKLGVQDVAGYKRVGGDQPMPRVLLIIDEFQEFFVQDDPIAQNASLLFDRIVRQGRAFGIHVLLGSQTLGGAYTLARATLGQMVIRVALQCNEADAYLIMDDNNPAPRLLSRPGEGIYNDAAGALEGNSPFQVVWLSDEERDEELEIVHELAARDPHKYPGPIVFEGNAPADIRENHLLTKALGVPAVKAPAEARAWLGAPNSIKGPTEAPFQSQSGNHLLIVGQRDEAIQTMLAVSLIALAAQYPAGGAKFMLLHAASPGSAEGDILAQTAGAIPDLVLANANNLGEVINDLATELKERSGTEATSHATPIFVFINGLQKFKKLRNEDDFDFSMDADSAPKPGAQLGTILSEGASHGIHLIVSVDTFNNVGRFLSRKALTEFEMRVVFQMSANDSASLIDSPAASNLGLHRALFHNEHQGYTETFRPYAPPDREWMEQALQSLSPKAALTASA
ncbi:hypothetical protein BH09VER1_BH09VER1_23720 [soil metagenome]